MKILLRLLPLALFVPVIASAKVGEFKELKDFFTGLTNLMNDVLIPAIFALGFLVFVWGMYKTFILGGSDEEKQGEGRQLMMYAVIGFVVMISLWGIVNLIAGSLELDDKQITPPTFKIDTVPKP